MSKQRPLFGMTSEQSADLAALLDHITEARRHGRHVPCQESNDPRPWTSEDLAQRAQAVRECYLCDAVRECRAYGVKYPAERGIIGGLDKTERSKIHNRKERSSCKGSE